MHGFLNMFGILIELIIEKVATKLLCKKTL